jgi:hypothetical protein
MKTYNDLMDTESDGLLKDTCKCQQQNERGLSSLKSKDQDYKTTVSPSLSNGWLIESLKRDQKPLRKATEWAITSPNFTASKPRESAVAVPSLSLRRHRAINYRE